MSTATSTHDSFDALPPAKSWSRLREKRPAPSPPNHRGSIYSDREDDDQLPSVETPTTPLTTPLDVLLLELADLATPSATMKRRRGGFVGPRVSAEGEDAGAFGIGEIRQGNVLPNRRELTVVTFPVFSPHGMTRDMDAVAGKEEEDTRPSQSAETEEAEDDDVRQPSAYDDMHVSSSQAPPTSPSPRPDSHTIIQTSPRTYGPRPATFDVTRKDESTPPTRRRTHTGGPRPLPPLPPHRTTSSLSPSSSSSSSHVRRHGPRPPLPPTPAGTPSSELERRDSGFEEPSPVSPLDGKNGVHILDVSGRPGVADVLVGGKEKGKLYLRRFMKTVKGRS